MNNRLTIGLRTFILGTSLFGVIFAFTYIYVIQPRIQAGKVKRLIELGDASPGCYGVEPRILVWYGADLEWIDTDERFILTTLDTRYDFHSKAGDDRQDHPVAVEIYCDPDIQKLKQTLQRLPSIRQVWICVHRAPNGALVGQLDLQKLQELFPDLIVCSPRIWGSRLEKSELEKHAVPTQMK